MPRKPSPQLTEAELRLMNVLWDRGRGTVADIAETLPTDPPLAYNTILTTLRILESKGYVRHSKESRAFVYEPIIDRDQATTGAVHHLLARFFHNSPGLLIANLLQDESLPKRDLDRIRKLLAGNKAGNQ